MKYSTEAALWFRINNHVWNRILGRTTINSRQPVWKKVNQPVWRRSWESIGNRVWTRAKMEMMK